MYNYTLAFIFYLDHVLLLNRHKKPWLGSWNGVGGKIQEGETIEDSLLREIYEETGIQLEHNALERHGIVTWNAFDALGSGLYLYAVHLKEPFTLVNPFTSEGILDWKRVDWICDKDNTGVAHNIPYFIKDLYQHQEPKHYHCTFENDRLIVVRVSIESKE